MASPNMAKLKAMVHYIIASVPAEQLGMTKLNKILWFSDREAFLKLGQTISGYCNKKIIVAHVTKGAC